MSDTTTDAAPIEDATEDETIEATTDAPEADEGQADDWRSNFDAGKAEARIRKLQSEAKNLRERAKAAEQKAAGADEKDQKISALEAKSLRYEVGFELGLPRELVNRLQGGTREELIEDARALVELMGPTKASTTTRKPVEALRGGGEPDRQPEETDVRKIGARMFSN